MRVPSIVSTSRPPKPPESIDDGSDAGSVQLESEDDEEEALEEHVAAASLPMYGLPHHSLKDEINSFQTRRSSTNLRLEHTFPRP